MIADDVEQRARELFNAISATDWEVEAHRTPGSPDAPAEYNYNISFDQEKVLSIIKSALQQAERSGKESAGKWQPISEYTHPRYDGYDPILVVGWWWHEGGGYSAGVRSFGCGYWSTITEKWVDVSDNRPWPIQPTHFAMICQGVLPPGAAT